MTTLGMLAEVLDRLELEQVPASSLHAARRCFIDALACAVAGRRHAAVQQARARAEMPLSPGLATI